MVHRRVCRGASPLREHDRPWTGVVAPSGDAGHQVRTDVLRPRDLDGAVLADGADGRACTALSEHAGLPADGWQHGRRMVGGWSADGQWGLWSLTVGRRGAWCAFHVKRSALGGSAGCSSFRAGMRRRRHRLIALAGSNCPHLMPSGLVPCGALPGGTDAENGLVPHRMDELGSKDI
jgi:hypothetical protein